MSVGTAVDQVIEELRASEKLLLTTHENPDGDALGSLLGMHDVLTTLGKDAVMFMSADEFPLPREYQHLPLDAVIHEPPADLHDRTLVFL
ncbi:MAG: bifunctional oligoribonuclease/PAP phosphatase NrnA, partial [Thermoleophilaceae bacterium]|nr:bifunctional oligoribonuclease/PAP phosphatase NrnA [Thermoleophilaceae bacterium]